MAIRIAPPRAKPIAVNWRAQEAFAYLADPLVFNNTSTLRLERYMTAMPASTELRQVPDFL